MTIVLPRSTGRRILAVDCLRATALAGMALFHFAWDLHAAGLTGLDPNADFGWHVLGQSVAATFLFLSGFGLVLAEKAGTSRTAIMVRLGLVAAAALLVTGASRVFAPDATITFGILHCIVVTNVIALVLRRCGTAMLVILGLLSLGLPYALPATAGGWTWLGLGALPPATLDYRPVFPWLGPVLFGVAAARSGIASVLARWRPRASAAHWFGGLGRHSLAFYLLHQPIFFALLAVVIPALNLNRQTVPMDAVQAQAFLRECTAACGAKETDAALCRSTCHCVLTGMTRRRDTNALAILRPRNAQDEIQAASELCLDLADPKGRDRPN